MYSKIFREIVDIMHHDYAGILDKKGWDHPKDYERKIKRLEREKALNPTLFTEIVNDYLLDFKDPHIYFKLKATETNKEYDTGFTVRRFENRLYVTDVTKEERLNVGDEIISLDYIPIDILVNKHRRELMEEDVERENWREILKKYYQCEVRKKDGTIISLELKKYEKAPYTPTYKIEKYNETTLLLTFTDFDDPDAIIKLLNNHEEELTKYENWIIDIRTNHGGSDVVFHLLVPYLFPEGENKIDLSEKYAMTFNCTENNYERLKALFTKEMETIEDERAKQSIQNYLNQFEKNKGKGFVELFPIEPEEFEGKSMPERVVVLIDRFCGSSGEVFADVCKLSNKVTLIGRPTYGMNGYANLTCAEWKDLFELYYPTSRLNSMDEGKTLLDVAVHPDVYIPWTPEHLEKDIDLLEAEKQFTKTEK